MQVLIVGCGDIGQRIASRLLAQGAAVTGVVQSAASAGVLRAAGIAPLQLDLDQPAMQWPAAEAIYWCAPPPTQGVDDPRLKAALRQMPVPAQGCLYVSTSGVYGDCQGRWIDEAEPLKPQTERGQRRLAAELHLRAWAARTGGKTITLRVPGIYGPGRLPLERLQKGLPIVKAEDSPWTNRIHADDLADAALLALTKGTAGAAYNVSDGAPTTMTDYFLRCAARLGLPPPPQLTLAEARTQLSPALMSFMEESKRLHSTALRALGWQPRHADLTAGLQHC